MVASRTAENIAEKIPEKQREQIASAGNKVAEQTQKVAAKAGVAAGATYETYVEKNAQMKEKTGEIQAKVYENLSEDAKQHIKETNEWYSEKKEMAKVKALDLTAPLVDKLLVVLNKIVKQKVVVSLKTEGSSQEAEGSSKC